MSHKSNLTLLAGILSMVCGSLIIACNDGDSATAAPDTATAAPTDPQSVRATLESLYGSKQSGQDAPSRMMPATTGIAREVIPANRYIYIRLETTSGSMWVAGPKEDISVGTTVQVSAGIVMKNFYSQTLDRTFESVRFADSIVAPESEAAPHETAAAPTPAPTKIEKVAPPEGGQSIAEIIRTPESFTKTPVEVRGRVVKFNPNILGYNWLHLQDGSGDSQAGIADLTITTQSQVAVGDIVTARGTISQDKDFGAGYRYPIIMENATISPAPQKAN